MASHADVFQPVYFQLNEDHIPDGFLQAGFWVCEARHLIFASEYLLSLQAFAKTWEVYKIFHGSMEIVAIQSKQQIKAWNKSIYIIHIDELMTKIKILPHDALVIS